MGWLKNLIFWRKRDSSSKEVDLDKDLELADKCAFYDSLESGKTDVAILNKYVLNRMIDEREHQFYPNMAVELQIGGARQDWLKRIATGSELSDGKKFCPYHGHMNGLFRITLEEMCSFYGNRGDFLSESSRLAGRIENGDELYIALQDNYAMFLLLNKKDGKDRVGVLNGNVVRFQRNDHDLQYYADNLAKMCNLISSATKDYYKSMYEISKEVMQIGGYGSVHGCIVDIDFFNHIMVNPFDGTLTFYYSPQMGTLKTFSSLSECLNSSTGNQDIARGLHNCLMPLNLITEYSTCMTMSDLMKIQVKGSMYSVSLMMMRYQRIFELGILRYWPENLERYLDMDSRSLEDLFHGKESISVD